LGSKLKKKKRGRKRGFSKKKKGDLTKTARRTCEDVPRKEGEGPEKKLSWWGKKRKSGEKKEKKKNMFRKRAHEFSEHGKRS